MNFLQPSFLALLPLVALPVIIHLVYQRRHRTMQWAAMMFLRDARQMSRGMARLRHLLILLARILAVAGLLFAVSRPMVTGGGQWLGGTVDTVFILLDRSASMEQIDVAIGQSKRSNGLAKIADYLERLGQPNQVVLIASGSSRAISIESLASLTKLPYVRGTSASADIPAMLQTVQAFMAANQTGNAEVWIVSDLRENDWNPQSGRWAAIQKSFGDTPGVEFRLLAYDEPPDYNIAVRIDHVQYKEGSQNHQSELVLDIHLKRTGSGTGPTKVPIDFIINGARTTLTVSMPDTEHVLQGFSLPLDKALKQGWGRVELPADANPADNVFYFTFSESPDRHTIIVIEDLQAAACMQHAVTASPDVSLAVSASVVRPNQLAEIDWDHAAMILWQAPLPTGLIAKQVEQFVGSGRSVVFFPPAVADATELFGMRWGEWTDSPAGDSPREVASWRNDAGLLRHVDSGGALPVGDLKISRHCSIHGACDVLASLKQGATLLGRSASRGTGAAYFCTTLPQPGYSTLASDGVVFYVMLQRALSIGAASLSGARQYDAGANAAREIAGSKPLRLGHAFSDQSQTASPTPQLQAGVFALDNTLIALNRPVGEDSAKRLSTDRIERLFAGAKYHQIRVRAEGSSPLAREIWRVLLIVMMLALLAEAILCMPPPQTVRDNRDSGMKNMLGSNSLPSTQNAKQESRPTGANA